MDEREYRDTYNAVNAQRCVFEKSINSRRSTCTSSRRIHLADREGIACNSAGDKAVCSGFLDYMRSNARFALHQTSTGGPLPHAREIKVQTGGMLGLQSLVYPERATHSNVDDIIGILHRALENYGSFEQLPCDVIVQSIVRFEGRRKRSRRPGRKD